MKKLFGFSRILIVISILLILGVAGIGRTSLNWASFAGTSANTPVHAEERQEPIPIFRIAQVGEPGAPPAPDAAPKPDEPPAPDAAGEPEEPAPRCSEFGRRGVFF